MQSEVIHMMKGPKKSVTVLMPIGLYQALRRRAAESDRTLPSYIRVILTRYMTFLDNHQGEDLWFDIK